MDIRVIASSSAGNAYVVTDGPTQILLDAGIPFTRLQIALDFRIRHLTAAFITHCHGDHSRSAADIALAGCPVFMSRETADAISLTHFRVINVEADKWYRAGGLRFMPLQMDHDVPCLGYYFLNRQGEALLFATDTGSIPYRFDRIDHLMIECNYDDDLLAAEERPFIRDRVRKTHMGLAGLLDFLEDSDLTHVRDITLLHLSDGHADEKKIKRAVEAATGKPVTIAQK